MGARVILVGIGVPLALAVAGSGLAAGRGRIVSLAAGQTRWFLPAALETGDTVRCVVHGRTIEVLVPAPPAAGAGETGYSWVRGGAAVAIGRRANGASEVTCGSGRGPAVRRPTLPYVIGQNGLGLIRGPNELGRLEQLFGRPSWHAASPCRARWAAIGLRARFEGARCTSRSVLRTATAAGARWSSLTGVRVGDPVARMRWQVPGARLVSSAHGRRLWLLASGGASHRARLLAASGRTARITSLTSVVR